MDQSTEAAVKPLLRVRQYRRFTDDPVAPDILDAIADAARWSGSSQNRQPWRFITITEPGTLRALADAGLPSTRSLLTATAAIAIVMPQQPGGGIWHAYDEGRAAERMLIAASQLGIGGGIAWLSAERRADARPLLHLPDDRYVRTIVALGHPSADARRPKSAPGEARLPRSQTVFAERWPD
jgi:nitroreductase